jgi:hypothetical protein
MLLEMNLLRDTIAINVSVGSKTEVELADIDFRSTPQSRHLAGGLACPKSANSRHHCPVRSTEIRVALVSPGEAAMKLRRRQFLHLAASAVALSALPTIASAQEPVGGRA